MGDEERREGLHFHDRRHIDNESTVEEENKIVMTRLKSAKGVPLARTWLLSAEYAEGPRVPLASPVNACVKVTDTSVFSTEAGIIFPLIHSNYST